MKKILQPFLRALAFCLSLAAAPQAQATHILGGDLTYVHLGTTGNLYRVKFRFYRDCSGTTVGSWDLNYRNSLNCNAAYTTVRMSVVGASTIGAPYCGSLANTCTTASPNPNFELTTYQADIALSPGVWSLFIYNDAQSRPNIANLTNVDRPTYFNCNGSENEMFLEATLDNTGGIFNNSPQFDPQDLVVQFVGLNQRSTITYSAAEADGDSLVYEMVQPYDRCGVPIPYASYTGGGNTGGTVPLPNGCTLTLPPAFTNFSTALPLPVALDTLGTCPNRRAVPAFYFNALARTINFKPNYFNPAGTANCGYNKYQVVMRISEYRRIGGVRRLVGTVVREGVIIVVNSTNQVPGAPVAANQTVNSNTVAVNTPDSLQVSVYAGNYTRVRLDFRDPDPADLLTVTYPLGINTSPAYLDNGAVGTFALVGNGTTHPVGTFILQPSLAAVGRIIRINLRAEDGACPVKGVQNRVLVIKVLGGNFARIGTTQGGVGVPPPFLSCSGSANFTLNGSIQRPDSVYAPAPITSASRKVLQAYTYQWSLLRGNGFDPAQAGNRSISVNPTITSRYRLTVTSSLGFSGTNQDTASVLVGVMQQPAQPTITRNGNLLTSSATMGNQWYFNGQPIPGATGVSYLATTPGSYTVVSSVGTPPLVCSSPVSAAVLGSRAALPGTSVSIAPNPTADGRVLVTLSGYRQAVTLNVLDALGRVVNSATVASPNPAGTAQALDLAALPTGVYVLRVLTAGGVDVRRLVRE